MVVFSSRTSYGTNCATFSKPSPVIETYWSRFPRSTEVSPKFWSSYVPQRIDSGMVRKHIGQVSRHWGFESRYVYFLSFPTFCCIYIKYMVPHKLLSLYCVASIAERQETAHHSDLITGFEPRAWGFESRDFQILPILFFVSVYNKI